MAARGRRLLTRGVLAADAATSVSLVSGLSQAETLGLQEQIDATPDGGQLELSGEYVTNGIVTIRQDFGTNGVTVGCD